MVNKYQCLGWPIKWHMGHVTSFPSTEQTHLHGKKVKVSALVDSFKSIRYKSIRYKSIRYKSIRYKSIRYKSIRYKSIRYKSG